MPGDDFKMAITVFTSKPRVLLANVKAQIASKKIRTWSVDEVSDFTHTPPQWLKKAWLRPKVLTDKLVFTILPPKNTKMSSEIYAIYHGRFIEMLLQHVDLEFSSASASALPVAGDIIDTTPKA
jgi:hypothetical protein